MRETTKDTTFNGWTNRPTWLVHLWIDNDEHSNHYWNGRARFVTSAAGLQESLGCYSGVLDADPDQRALAVLEDELKENYTAQESDLLGLSGVFIDLLAHVLSEVNFREIADSLITGTK